jgi:DNA-binding beta-propeller fold protein YncE
MIKKTLYQLFILTFLSVIILSCSKDLSKSSGVSDLVIFPPPPDITRIQYLTSISTSTDIRGKQSSFNRFMFGEEIPKPVIKPYGITVHDSKIYICDTGLGGLCISDLAAKSFDYFTPSGKGQLQLPLNCSVDEKGFLFVADGNRRQIVVFDSEGKYVSEFGETGESFKPTDVYVFRDKIFVVSVKDQRVFVYDKNSYRLITDFPAMEPGDDGYLYQPTNLFADQKCVYVSDMGDNKIKVYSHEGTYLRSVGGYGNYAGQLMRPKGVAVDEKSNLYVVDAAFENVQIFDQEGKILMFFGGPYKKKGDMWLPADVTISYTGLDYFSKYVDKSFNLKYLIFVTNQYGPDKISVYGFVEPVK